MAQADGVVANGTGSAVRSDINGQYAALWSNHSGSTEPSTGKVAYQFWADTNTNILKIRNSGNNGWVSLFTLAGGVDVDAASNFNNDVTFTGSSANAFWDKSDNSLEFGDTATAKFGDSGDLLISCPSTGGVIQTTTGALTIATASLHINNAADSEQCVHTTENSGVEIFFDDTKRIESTSYGAAITGGCIASSYFKVNDNSKFYAGDDEDMWIYHDSTASFVDDRGTGILRLRGNEVRICNLSNETFFAGTENSDSKIYYDDSVKLTTKSDGITISGQLSTSTTANTTVPVEVNDTSNTATHTHRIKFATGGTEVGRIRSSNSATTYDTSGSDRALKKNFEDWEQDVLNLFKNINPQKFHFIQEEDTAEKSKGFIAQEMVDSFPEAYTKEDKEDSKYYFNPSGMVVYLMKAVQELIVKIDAMENV